MRQRSELMDRQQDREMIKTLNGGVEKDTEIELREATGQIRGRRSRKARFCTQNIRARWTST